MCLPISLLCGWRDLATFLEDSRSMVPMDSKFHLFLGFQKDVLFQFVQCWLLAFCIITMHPRPPPRPLHMLITSTSLRTPQHNGLPLLKLLEFLWTYGLCRLTGGKLGWANAEVS